MKQKLTTLLVALTLSLQMLSLAAPASVEAVNVFPLCSTTAKNTDVCKSQRVAGNSNPVVTALKVVITIMSVVVGIVSVIMIIIGGIKMVTSGGNPQQIASARGTIIAALVGLLIAVLAESIVTFVLVRI